MRSGAKATLLAALGAAALFGVAALPASAAVTVQGRALAQRCTPGGDFAQVLLGARTNSDAGPVTVQWDFTNDGTLDTQPSTRMATVHAYPDEGTFTARVVATTADGQTASDTFSVVTQRCP